MSGIFDNDLDRIEQELARDRNACSDSDVVIRLSSIIQHTESQSHLEAADIESYCKALKLRATICLTRGEESLAIDDLQAALEAARTADSSLVLDIATTLKQATNRRFDRKLIDLHFVASNAEIQVHRSKNDWVSVEVASGRLLTLAETVYGAHHPETYEALQALAESQLMRQQFENALPHLERLAGFIYSQRSNTIECAQFSSAIGQCYDRLARLADARSSYETAYHGFRKHLGADAEETVAQCFNVGEIARLMKDCPSAERWFRRAADAESRARGTKSGEYATIINNLGEIFDSLGQFERARRCIRLALSIREELFGLRSPEYSRSTQAWERVLLNSGGYNECVRSFLDDDAPQDRKQHKGRDNEAADSHQQTAASRQNVDAHVTVDTTRLLALTYSGQAAVVFEQLEASIQELISSAQPKLMHIEPYLVRAISGARCGLWRNAYDDMQRVLDLDVQSIVTLFEYGSRVGVRWLMQNIRLHVSLLLKALSEIDKPSDLEVRQAFDRVQLTKGLETRIHQLQKDLLINSGIKPDATLKEAQLERARLHQQLTQLLLNSQKQRIKNLDQSDAEFRGNGVGVQSDVDEAIAKLKDQIEICERRGLMELDASACAGYLNGSSGWMTQLAPKHTCIEFVEISDEMHHLPSEAEKSYAAFLHLPNGALHFHVLGHSHDINHAVSNLRNELLNHSDSNRWRRPGRFLFNKLLRPFQDFLTETEHLYIAPEGVLWDLPWDILPVDETRQLIDVYSTSFLWQSGELGTFNLAIGAVPPATPPMVIANPNFERVFESAPNREDCENGGSQTNTTSLGRRTFSTLAHGTAEAEHIAKLLNAKLYLGDEATKEQLVGASSPYIIHLATHSFFLPWSNKSGNDQIKRTGVHESADDQFERTASGELKAHTNDESTSSDPAASEETATQGFSSTADAEYSSGEQCKRTTRDDSVPTPRIEVKMGSNYKRAHSPNVLSARMYLEDPSERCGIALAGAENDLRIIGARSPGIIYGAELEDLDWRSTELVTVSSCQSALGDIRPGDGTHGLRRAFRAAGCKRVVSALWKVPDEATKLLMRAFYDNLEKGLDCGQALQIAKLEIRTFQPDPFYWSGFVLDGNAAKFPLSMPEPIKFATLSATECDAVFGNSNRLLAKAYECLDRGDFNGARVSLTQVLESRGASADARADALMMSARIAFKSGNSAQAIIECDTALRLEGLAPKTVTDLRRERATYKIASNDLFGAVMDLTHVIDAQHVTDTERAWCLVNRSFALLTAREFAAAHADCSFVMNMRNAPHEQQMKALLNRVRVGTETGAMQEAIADCTWGLTKTRNDVFRNKLYLSRGDLLRQQGKIAQSINDLKSSMKLLQISHSPELKKAIKEIERMVAAKQPGPASESLGRLFQVVFDASQAGEPY